MNIFDIDYDTIERLEHKVPIYSDLSMDINGEYEVVRGSKRLEVSSFLSGLPFNIYGTISQSYSKKRKNKNSKEEISFLPFRRGNTNGWNYDIYISLFYSNGRDIKILSGKSKTLKEIREKVLQKIEEYKKLNKEELLKLEGLSDYKNRSVKAVFIYDEKNSKYIYIGESYHSVSQEIDKYKKREIILNNKSNDIDKMWYYEDIPDYTKHLKITNLFYSLDKSFYTENGFSFWESKIDVWGYTSSGKNLEEDILEDLLNQLDKSKYSRLFN